MIDQSRSLSVSKPGAGLALPASDAFGAAPPGEEFSSMLMGLAKQSIETMRQGEQAAVAGINGTAPIQEVVDKVMAAEQALQTTLAVREKVVSAWLEISRMTI